MLPETDAVREVVVVRDVLAVDVLRALVVAESGVPWKKITIMKELCRYCG